MPRDRTVSTPYIDMSASHASRVWLRSKTSDSNDSPNFTLRSSGGKSHHAAFVYLFQHYFTLKDLRDLYNQCHPNTKNKVLCKSNYYTDSDMPTGRRHAENQDHEHVLTVIYTDKEFKLLRLNFKEVEKFAKEFSDSEMPLTSKNIKNAFSMHLERQAFVKIFAAKCHQMYDVKRVEFNRNHPNLATENLDVSVNEAMEIVACATETYENMMKQNASSFHQFYKRIEHGLICKSVTVFLGKALQAFLRDMSGKNKMNDQDNEYRRVYLETYLLNWYYLNHMTLQHYVCLNRLNRHRPEEHETRVVRCVVLPDDDKRSKKIEYCSRCNHVMYRCNGRSEKPEETEDMPKVIALTGWIFFWRDELSKCRGLWRYSLKPVEKLDGTVISYEDR